MNRVHSLSDSEIAALECLHRRTENANVRSRYDMILWSNEALSPPQIAELVRFRHDTVSRYIARYENEGIQGLLPRPRSGPPRKVTVEYEALLLELVAQEPHSLGLAVSNWTTAHLATELARRTRIA